MKKTTQHGQSITEFLVALAFLAPIVLFIPTLANMLSLQTEAYKASRYAAWERTAYTGTNLKDSQEMSDEIKTRFFEQGSQGFASNSAPASGVQQRWMDFKNKINMVNLKQSIGMDLQTSQSPTAKVVNSTSSLAGVGGQNNPDYAVQLNTLQVAQISVPLRSDISLLQARKAVDAWHTKVTGDNPDTPYDPLAKTNQFYIGSSSALVADGWTATNEQMFHDRVAGVTAAAEGGLQFWENTGLIHLLGGMFKEIPQHLFSGPSAKKSLDIVDPNQSVNLPEYVKK